MYQLHFASSKNIYFTTVTESEEKHTIVSILNFKAYIKNLNRPFSSNLSKQHNCQV